MPSKTYISKEKQKSFGYRASNNLVSLLFCGNTTGDYFVKPMLVSKSVKPLELRGKDKAHLSIYWSHNRKAFVTAVSFISWFNNCFVHEVELYLTAKNLPFKALLVLDDISSVSRDFVYAHPNVELIFLPSNTGSILHPMNQGIISAFKCHYTRHTLTGILDLVGKNSVNNFAVEWERYNIADAIVNMKFAIQDIQQSTRNRCWKKLWPEVVNHSKEETQPDEIYKITLLFRAVGGDGFEGIEESEVEEYLESRGEEITEECIEGFMEAHFEDSVEEDEASLPPSKLTTDALGKILHTAKELTDLVFDCDPFMERSCKFKRDLLQIISPYKDLLKDMQIRQRQSIFKFDKPNVYVPVITTIVSTPEPVANSFITKDEPSDPSPE